MVEQRWPLEPPVMGIGGSLWRLCVCMFRSSAPALWCGQGFLLLLGENRVLKKSVQIQVIGQENHPYLAPPHHYMLQLGWRPVWYRHLHVLQGDVHIRRHSDNGPMYQNTALEFNLHGFILHLHQQSNKLHIRLLFPLIVFMSCPVLSCPTLSR